MVQRITRSWVQSIESKDEKDDEERIDPCMSNTVIDPPAHGGTRFSALGGRTRGSGIGRSLYDRRISWSCTCRSDQGSHIQASMVVKGGLEEAQVWITLQRSCLLSTRLPDCSISDELEAWWASETAPIASYACCRSNRVRETGPGHQKKKNVNRKGNLVVPVACHRSDIIGRLPI